ncbi:hypothetical protein H4R33_003830 [Dimargaris cristalligena]|nr:hypothetical protein H4R33_003830 [Dimargaris cristalligena]
MSAELPDDVKDKLAKLENYEKRFADLIKSFKKLTAQKKAADAILKEVTPLRTIADAEALEAHLKNLNLKTEMSSGEIKRLTTERDEAKKQLKAFTEEKKKQSESQSSLKNELESARKAVTELQASKSELQQSLAEEKSAYEEVATERQVVQEKCAELQDKCETLSRERADAHESYQLRISELQSEIRGLKNQEEIARATKSQLGALHSEVKDAVEGESPKSGEVVEGESSSAAVNVDGLCRSVHRALKKITETQDQLATLSNENDHLSQSLQEAHKERDALKQEVATAREMPSELTAEPVALAQSDAVLDDITRLSQQLAQIKMQLFDKAGVIQEGESLVIAGDSKPPTLDATESATRSDSPTPEPVVDPQELIELRQQYGDAQQTIRKLEDTAEAQRDEIVQLKESLVARADQVSQLKADVQSHQDRQRELISSAEALQGAIDTKVKQLNAREGEIKDLQSQIETQSTRQAELESRIKEEQATQKTAEGQLRELQTQHDQIEEVMVKQKQQLNATREHLETSEEKVMTLTDQLERSQRQARQQTTELQQTNDELKKAHGRLHQMEKEVENIHANNRKQLDEMAKKNESLSKCRESMESQQSEFNQTREQLENIQADLTTSRQLFEEKSAKLDQTKTRLHETEMELKQALANLEQLRSESTRLQQVLRDELAQHRQNAIQAVNTVRQELADRTEELHAFRAETQPKLGLLHQVESERDTLQNQLGVLRATIQTLEDDAVQQKLEIEQLQGKQKQWVNAKRAQEQAMNDLSLRESHWRKVNRDLKEEVKRLQRNVAGGSLSSSTTAGGAGLGRGADRFGGSSASLADRALSPQLTLSPRLRPGHSHMGPSPGLEFDSRRSSTNSPGGALSPSPEHRPNGMDDSLRPPPTPPRQNHRDGRDVTPVGEPMLHAHSTPTASLHGAAGATSTASSPTGRGHRDSVDDVNLEYIRHVVLKFLEQREHRAQLIPVLALLLKCSPEEVHRLNGS